MESVVSYFKVIWVDYSVYQSYVLILVKVCPHAGGIGLCEMVQHLQFWDYISLSCSKEGKFIEYVDQQHEHFKVPAVIKSAAYIPPLVILTSVDL